MNFDKSAELFKSYLQEIGHKENTIRGYLLHLRTFFRFLTSETEIRDIREVTEKSIRTFLIWLENVISEKRKKFLSRRTKNSMFLTVRMFFKSLYLKEIILLNPALSIQYKPEGESLEKVILSEEEINTLLDSIDGKDFLSRRDRTLFELIYSSGLRAGEVCNLKLSDVNFEESMILVRLGKFGKDRIVPVSETALLFLKKFTSRMKKDRYLFFNLSTKEKLSSPAVNKRLKKYLKEAGIQKEKVTTHSIRHSTASHLIDRGADLRYVQTLLGHESMETTVVYTHLLSESLKRVYRSHHPRENSYYEETDSSYMADIKALEISVKKMRRIKELNPLESGLNHTEMLN